MCRVLVFILSANQICHTWLWSCAEWQEVCVGPSQRSQFLVLTKRSSSSGDENVWQTESNTPINVKPARGGRRGIGQDFDIFPKIAVKFPTPRQKCEVKYTPGNDLWSRARTKIQISRDSKIIQMPYPRAKAIDQIPALCPASNPPSPPPQPAWHW